MSAFYLANGSFVVDKTSQEHYLKHTANQYHCARRVHSEHKPQPEMTMRPQPEMTMKPQPEMTMKPKPEMTMKPKPEMTMRPQPEMTMRPKVEVKPKMETIRPEMARVPAEESLKMTRVGQGAVEKFMNCPYNRHHNCPFNCPYKTKLFE